MSKRIIRTGIRLNLANEADQRAWAYLQRLDREKHKSYSRAIVEALNDFFDRQERLANDPYLETREKEDAFLQNVLNTIANGIREAVIQNSGGQIPLLRKPNAQNVDSPPGSETEQDAENNAVLDFLDSF